MAEELIHSEERGEIVLYQPNDNIRLEVRLQDETVWLTQHQMAELFSTTRNNITLHIGNIFKEGELDVNSVRKESLLTALDGKKGFMGSGFKRSSSVVHFLGARKRNQKNIPPTKAFPRGKDANEKSQKPTTFRR